MIKLPNHTSLKEWSSVVDALGCGDQVILLRKGGIADPKFGVEADRFYLYPTFFHQPQAANEPQTVEISYWCEVARTWSVTELDALRRLAPLVSMPLDAMETRYRFRPDQALHVIGVRTFVLPQPQTIAVRSEYIGCRSWVSIDDEIDVIGSRAVMPESELKTRLEAVGGLLAPRVTFTT